MAVVTSEDPAQGPSASPPAAVQRLVLVRHAPTRATRSSSFPADEPLDERGFVAAAALGDVLPKATQVLSSPALRCRQTAEAAGRSARVEPRIRDCAFGTWAGLSLDDVQAIDPAGLAAWFSDPDAAPHGGESLAVLKARVGVWLDEDAPGGGWTVAITHAEVVKAAVVHILGAPLSSFWQIDVAPLSLTELHRHDGRWRLTRTNDLRCEA